MKKVFMFFLVVDTDRKANKLGWCDSGALALKQTQN